MSYKFSANKNNKNGKSKMLQNYSRYLLLILLLYKTINWKLKNKNNFEKNVNF